MGGKEACSDVRSRTESGTEADRSHLGTLASSEANIPPKRKFSRNIRGRAGAEDGDRRGTQQDKMDDKQFPCCLYRTFDLSSKNTAAAKG